jgi:isopentenyl phosphate kinase
MRKDLVLIKLGGSVITNKKQPFSFRKKTVDRLAREIRKSVSSKTDFIIAHGGGSFGHPIASRYKTQDGMRTKRDVFGAILAHDAVCQLNQKILASLVHAGVSAVAFAPFTFISASKREANPFSTEMIEKTLAATLTPVLHGDIIFDSHQGVCIFSAEKILSLLVEKLSKKYARTRIIFCTDTDGIYDASGKTIPIITPGTSKKFLPSIGPSRGADVTGGMKHKLETALSLASRFGIETVILNGNRANALATALTGKIVPYASSISKR